MPHPNVNSATKPTLSPAAAAFFQLILHAMQNLEEMGGTDDYEIEMAEIVTACVEKYDPVQPVGFTVLDDIGQYLRMARESLSTEDSDALHQATRAEAETRTATYRENMGIDLVVVDRPIHHAHSLLTAVPYVGLNTEPPIEFAYEAHSPSREPSDDELRALWRDAGGRFHGPNVETGTMEEAQLLVFLRNLAKPSEEVVQLARNALSLLEECQGQFDEKFLEIDTRSRQIRSDIEATARTIVAQHR